MTPGRSHHRLTAIRPKHGTRVEAPSRLPVACAWCGRQQRRDGTWANLPPPGEPVSHGMCADCLRQYQVSASEPSRH